ERQLGNLLAGLALDRILGLRGRHQLAGENLLFRHADLQQLPGDSHLVACSPTATHTRALAQLDPRELARLRYARGHYSLLDSLHSPVEQAAQLVGRDDLLGCQELDRLDKTASQVVERERTLGLQFRGERLALVRDLAEPASVFRWVELRIGFEATLVRTLDLFAEGQQFGLADFPDIVMAEPRLADTDDDLLEV